MNSKCLYKLEKNRNAAFFFGFRKFCSLWNNGTTIRVIEINSKKRMNSISTLDGLMNWYPSCVLVTIVHRGVQVPPEKTQSHLQSQLPPAMTLLKPQQNFQTCLKSNFLFTPISSIYFKMFSKWLESKLGRLSLIAIYWYQSINWLVYIFS